MRGLATFADSLKVQKKLDVPKNITFGVEIEFEHAPISVVETRVKRSKIAGLLSNGWVLKQDNSLITYKDSIGIGGELTSPVLHNTIEAYKEIRNACHLIQVCGGVATENCGAHIHVGSQILEDKKKYYIRLMKLWMVYENEIVRFALGESSTIRPLMDYYAKTNAYIFRHADLYEKEKTCDVFEMFDSLGSDKKQALSLYNLKKYCEYHTLEVRCPSGTINPNIWINNINFFLNLFLACKDDSKDWDMIDKKYEEVKKIKKLKHIIDYDIEKAVELCDFVFDKTLDKHNFLTQYEKDSKVLTL